MEDFYAKTQQSGILLRKNGDFDDPGKVVCVELHWSFSEFLRVGSERLDLFPRAIRAFNIDGVEINDCMMIGDADSIFLSLGEAFISPTPVKYVGDTDDNGESLNEPSNMPSYVGMYNVGILLGCGAFGEVRLGTNKLTDEKVALKFLRKADIQSMGAAERTATEIQCLTTLNHRNIIRLFMRVEIHKYVVLVFDLMEGGDMFQYMTKKGSTAATAALSDDEARRVFSQVLAGIDFAHKHRIIHRDLKLENLLLKDDSLRIVKIADFGLSQFCRPGVLIKSDGSGTLSTAAPELLSSKACNAGPPIDVWAMGVVLFAMLCGRLPFEGPDMLGEQPSVGRVRRNIIECKYTIDDRVGTEAKDLLRRILRADPAERATTAQILSHSWLRPRISPSKDGEIDAGTLQEEIASSSSYNDPTESESSEQVPENTSRGGRDRTSPHKLSSITEDTFAADYFKQQLEQPDDSSALPAPAKGCKPPITVETKSPCAFSIRRSPMRSSCSALDHLTDELDKSIFDSIPSAISFNQPSNSTPSSFLNMTKTLSDSDSMKFGMCSDRVPAPIDTSESLCDIKGWGVPRARNSSGTGPRSPTYDRSPQPRTPTRNISCDALPLVDEPDRASMRSRVVIDDRLKSLGRHSSSFSFNKQSPSSTSTTSAATSSYSSRNNSTRGTPQLSQNALSDELDKRLVSLDKRLYDIERVKGIERKPGAPDSPATSPKRA